MTFYQPVLWFEFLDRLRHRWRVELSCPTLSPELGTVGGKGGCYGYCVPDKRLIVIDIRETWLRQQRTLFHELGHAALVERPDIPDKAEENAVTMLADPLCALLTRPPFGLQTPARPALWGKFRRWARFVDPS